MWYWRSFDGDTLTGSSPATTPLAASRSVARVSVEWAMSPAARATLVKVRSPLPIAAKTMRAWAWSGNSAANVNCAETTSGLIGLASSRARNERVFPVPPPSADHRQPAGHECRVERLGGCQAGHRGDVRRIQRPHSQLRAPLAERTVVRGERFHHRQVGTDQDQQDLLAGQFPVPRALQHALERAVRIHEVRQFVEDDDNRPVVRKHPRQLPEGRRPVPRHRLGEHSRFGQR
jgi:hypothetical protein